MNTQRSQARIVIPILAMLTIGIHARAADVVTRLSDGAALRGELGVMDSTSIVLKRPNGQEVKVSVDDIKSVAFDGEPAAISQARSNERSGVFDKALEKLTDARQSLNSSNRNARVNLDFLIARVKARQAALDSSVLDDAITTLNSFRNANKGSFRYVEATLLQASLLSRKKDTEEGKLLLAEVQSSGVPGYQLQAGVDLGRLLLVSGEVAAAMASFDQVISECEGKTNVSKALYNGLLGKAACLQNQKDLDGAIAILDQVIESASDNDTQPLAEAWLRKGDYLRQKNQPKAALLAYLYVDVLYSGESAQHAEALARLSQLWGPGGHADRAIEASARLAERYPNSQWARAGGGG